MGYDPQMGTIKFKLGNTPVEVDNADLAVEIIRKFAAEPESTKPRRRASLHSDTVILERKITPNVTVHDSFKPDPLVLKDALRFLEVIKHGGDNGAESDKVAKALGAEPRGIGSKLRWIKSLLTHLGFDPTEVYFRTKIPTVGHFWRSGPEFNNAYSMIVDLS